MQCSTAVIHPIKNTFCEPYLPTRDENNHHVIHVAAIIPKRRRRHVLLSNVVLMTWRSQTSLAESMRHSERHISIVGGWSWHPEFLYN